MTIYTIMDIMAPSRLMNLQLEAGDATSTAVLACAKRYEEDVGRTMLGVIQRSACEHSDRTSYS